MYVANKIRTNNEFHMLDFDPGATAATIVDLDPATGGVGLPIATFGGYIAGLMRSVGTGTVTSFEIIAGTDANLTGATQVVAHALGAAPDAVADTIWLECLAEQILDALPAATHVGVRIALAAAADECAVFFGRTEPLYATGLLTTDFIS